MSGEVVQDNYWVCDLCKSPNDVERHPTHCPCGHERSTCCFEAGDPLPVLALSPIAPGFLSMTPSGPFAHTYPNAYDDGGYHGGIRGPALGTVPGMLRLTDTSDAWTCPNCGAANSGLTPGMTPYCSSAS
jgi:rubredoxin